ncbi:hypothetical protein E8E11_011562 [Didymella keratinophila]|nr:hypothetical protein E8E11_011562 [Didymella keratinophila]
MLDATAVYPNMQLLFETAAVTTGLVSTTNQIERPCFSLSFSSAQHCSEPPSRIFKQLYPTTTINMKSSTVAFVLLALAAKVLSGGTQDKEKAGWAAYAVASDFCRDIESSIEIEVGYAEFSEGLRANIPEFAAAATPPPVGSQVDEACWPGHQGV